MTLKFYVSITVLRAEPRISIILMGLGDRHGYSLLTWDLTGQIFIQLMIFVLQNIIEHLLCVSVFLSTRNVVVNREGKILGTSRLVREFYLKRCITLLSIE